ncbi:hypothetical protein AB0F77_38480 [Streptomyces sp. NPDC026672]|uniref:hypothetical protein n=1 Tax=Streptomyces sp. NPDC026672 TaxID=3155252 RepID=UPI0033D3F262
MPLALAGTAHAAGSPSCAAEGDLEFPLTARIRGGPESYVAGGGFRTWFVDLRNTTDRSCADVHPVVVLVDAERSLTPAQARLEFYDGSQPRSVGFETTDEHELVGVFEADGFDGFTVAPGGTVSVRIRLAVTSDAVPNDVTAGAAVVQRHEDGEDGDWVGQSNDYRFRVEGPDGERREEEPGEEPDGTTDEETAGGTDRETQGEAQGEAQGETEGEREGGTGEGDGTGRTSPDDGGGPASRAPADGSGTGPPASAPSGTGPPTATTAPDATTASELPYAAGAAEPGDGADELASTGSGVVYTAAAVAVLAVGGGAYTVARRRR